MFAVKLLQPCACGQNCVFCRLCPCSVVLLVYDDEVPKVVHKKRYGAGVVHRSLQPRHTCEITSGGGMFFAVLLESSEAAPSEVVGLPSFLGNLFWYPLVIPSFLVKKFSLWGAVPLKRRFAASFCFHCLRKTRYRQKARNRLSPSYYRRLQ